MSFFSQILSELDSGMHFTPCSTKGVSVRSRPWRTERKKGEVQGGTATLELKIHATESETLDVLGLADPVLNWIGSI